MRYWFASFYGDCCRNDKGSYGRVFKIRETRKETIEKFEKLSKRSYSYRWPDGWWVGVEFIELDSEKTYRKIKKNLYGDLGYSWIKDNIIDHGTPEDLDDEFMRKVIEGDERYIAASEI